MAIHSVLPTLATLHGHFSCDLPPVLTVQPGDTVRFQTLDAGWRVFARPAPFERPPKLEGRDRERDPGHALCGPVLVAGAQPGMTLEVQIHTIRTGTWGWSMAGGFDTAWNRRLGLAEGPECFLHWVLDPDTNMATNQFGRTLAMRPFVGILGMPPDAPGQHSTVPPRFCGGNIDCKELIAGSTLYLPIAVPGGLFSLGDGHALQGDGEVAGPALECPMECVEVTLQLHPTLRLQMPRAHTPAGWVSFGFHTDLHEAAMMALEGMLEIMHEHHGLDRAEALALASLVVDLRVTQLVNGTCGIHALLPHGALGQ